MRQREDLKDRPLLRRLLLNLDEARAQRDGMKGERNAEREIAQEWERKCAKGPLPEGLYHFTQGVQKPQETWTHRGKGEWSQYLTLLLSPRQALRVVSQLVLQLEGRWAADRGCETEARQTESQPLPELRCDLYGKLTYIPDEELDHGLLV